MSTTCQLVRAPSVAAADSSLAAVRPPSTTVPAAWLTSCATLKPMPVAPPIRTTVRFANACSDR
ncbi:hypothetical protein EB73_32535 [Mycobacterium sp. SWH-M3]|nr:hypothetical protein EB73_32535 [Mycobacterium sp. SWH-M3]